MGNTWFQFKQFRVEQADAAMKVTTEACVFGAWLAEKFAGKALQSSLDIGTGTGLLALMLAQKIDGFIDAVEIDFKAFREARENARSSPFHDRIHVQQGDIANVPLRAQYDLIICNPPFYSGSLRSPIDEINLARHESALTIDKLIHVSSSLLRGAGNLALLLPFFRHDECLKIARDAGLSLKEECFVRQTEKHEPFRVFFIFSSGSVDEILHEEFCIREEGAYSSRFRTLLRDYYLAF